jgi:hypothetical protein
MMRELLRTNDLVLLSYITALLQEVNIESMIADTHTSAIEGSIGAIQRRLLVGAEDVAAAKRIMIDAGLAEHLSDGHGLRS